MADIPEYKTKEWAQRVQQEAIKAVTGGNTSSDRVDLNADTGYELLKEIVASVIGTARKFANLVK